MARKKSSMKPINPLDLFADLKAFNRQKKARHDRAMEDARELVGLANRCKEYGTNFTGWTEACAHAFFYDSPRLPKRK